MLIHFPFLATNTYSASVYVSSSFTTTPKSFPDCWTNDQFDFFKKEHDWLFARDGKLDCTICRKIGGLASVSKTGDMKEQLSPEWTTCSINCSGTNQSSTIEISAEKNL